MENQVTSIEQSKRLLELGVPAVKAFCAVHCPKGCPFDNSEECGALREFKRKMIE